MKNEVNGQGLLKFSEANDKLKKLQNRTGRKVRSMSLKAGYSCPGAKDCKAHSDSVKRLKVAGKDTEFVCFAASLEAIFPGFNANNQHNFDLVVRTKAEDQLVELILRSLEANGVKDGEIFRPHIAGDYVSEKYFRAWMRAAALRPLVHFYACTKSVHYWIRNLDLVPSNFNLTASKGGRFDALISEHGLKYSQVVYSEAEAEALGLEIDHDDSHACFGDKPFGLLIHGAQKKGSKAAEAVAEIIKARKMAKVAEMGLAA